MPKTAAPKKPAKASSAKKTESPKQAKSAAVPALALHESGDCPVPAKVAAVAAPKAAPASKPAATPARKPSATPVTVVVRYDAGWGNSLHLRGEGPGLSWDVGAPLCCVKGDEWVWVAPHAGTVVFKVLHNDNAWSLGENIIAASGETVKVTPIF